MICYMIFFFKPFNVADYTDFQMLSSLVMWNQSHLVMVYSFYIFFYSICEFFTEFFFFFASMSMGYIDL